MTQLLVFEKTPANAAMFDRIADVELREVRSLKQLERAINERPPHIVAIEVPACRPSTQSTSAQDFTKVVALIQRLKSAFPSCAVIAMPTSTLTVGSSWLYEAGVDVIFRSMLDREKVAKLIRKVANRASFEEPVHLSFQQRVFDSLPWKKHST